MDQGKDIISIIKDKVEELEHLNKVKHKLIGSDRGTLKMFGKLWND